MDPGISKEAIGFASVVGAAAVGAVATALVQAFREKRRRIRARQADIYYRLMMLRTLWWPMVLNDGHADRVDPRDRRAIHDAAWQLSDVVRSADDRSDLKDIVRILFSEEFGTAGDRYAEMERVISRLGQKANPNYVAATHEVSRANLERGMEHPERVFSAPAGLI